MLDQLTTAPPVAHREKRGTLARQVGAQIKRQRKARGVTLLVLAQRCGTTPQTMQRLESAKMTLSLDWIEAIASALGVEPIQLLDAGVSDAIEKANAKAMRAQIRLATMNALYQQLCGLVNEIVSEDAGEEGASNEI